MKPMTYGEFAAAWAKMFAGPISVRVTAPRFADERLRCWKSLRSGLAETVPGEDQEADVPFVVVDKSPTE